MWKSVPNLIRHNRCIQQIAGYYKVGNAKWLQRQLRRRKNRINLGLRHGQAAKTQTQTATLPGLGIAAAAAVAADNNSRQESTRFGKAGVAMALAWHTHTCTHAHTDSKDSAADDKVWISPRKWLRLIFMPLVLIINFFFAIVWIFLLILAIFFLTGAGVALAFDALRDLWKNF